LWNETTIGKIVEKNIQPKKKMGIQPNQKIFLRLKEISNNHYSCALVFFLRDHITLITDGVRKNKIQCVKPDFPTFLASAHYMQILTKIQFNPIRVT
jgi:hypothetical protein